MLAVISLPRGFETTLAGAATLSQAHLIQPDRALEAELQVRSSFFESPYSYTRSFVSHQNRRFQAPEALPVLEPQVLERAAGAYQNSQVILDVLPAMLQHFLRA